MQKTLKHFGEGFFNKERQIKMNEEQERVEELDDAFNEGMIFALHLVSEKIETITTELKDKGFEQPNGFSVLIGYIEDTVKEVEDEQIH